MNLGGKLQAAFRSECREEIAHGLFFVFLVFENMPALLLFHQTK